MGHTRYAWHEIYVSALRESDPTKLIARIETAIEAIERRRAEWGTDPGAPAELKAIRKAIAALKDRLRGKPLRRAS